MNRTCGVIWFRNDLRCYDNEALHEAMKSCDQVVGIYVFDDRLLNSTSAFGFPRLSPLRLAFMTSVVRRLKDEMSAIGGRLIVQVGRPEDKVIDLVRRVHARWVFCNRERTKEEVEVQDAIEERLWQIGREMRYSRGKMLIHTADLPFPVSHVPDSFAIFRKEVSFLSVRPCFEAPVEITSPRLDDIADSYPDTDHRMGDDVHAWIAQLLDKELLLDVDNDANQVPRSPALAMGVLSPKELYHELVRQRPEVSMIKPSELVSHLLIRDHKRFMGKKYGDLIFYPSGIQGHVPISSEDGMDLHLEALHEARTGENLIDAAIRCLKATGFLPNPMRVLVANFIIYQTRLDWSAGAELFEAYLLDYDPCSNYINWQQIAGIGPDGDQKAQALNLENQARILDPEGTFRARWS